MSERLPPGTWIETDSLGEGVVLAIKDLATQKNVLHVLCRNGVRHIVESGIDGNGPAVWKLERTALDLHASWGRRWAWWWLREDIYRAPVCACCGYPNFGQGGGSWFKAKECLICGYPDFGAGFDNDDVPRVFHAGGCWRHRNAWDFPDYPEPDEPDTSPPEPSDREWGASGYSVVEARRNFETQGVMFRLGDVDASSTPALAGLRQSLIQLLEKRMAEPSCWKDEDDRAVERVSHRIVIELETARALPCGSRQGRIGDDWVGTANRLSGATTEPRGKGARMTSNDGSNRC